MNKQTKKERRLWNEFEKKEIAKESYKTSVHAVVGKYKVNPSMVYKWRKEFKNEIFFAKRTLDITKLEANKINPAILSSESGLEEDKKRKSQRIRKLGYSSLASQVYKEGTFFGTPSIGSQILVEEKEKIKKDKGLSVNEILNERLIGNPTTTGSGTELDMLNTTPINLEKSKEENKETFEHHLLKRNIRAKFIIITILSIMLIAVFVYMILRIWGY